MIKKHPRMQNNSCSPARLGIYVRYGKGMIPAMTGNNAHTEKEKTMKTIYALTALLAAQFATAAIASETIVFQGCEMKQADNGNYFFKVDAGCQFNSIENGAGIGAEGPSEAE